MLNLSEQEIRQMVKDAGVKMLEENLVQGTWGNISIRLDKTRMLVTPSGA
jgi:Ribulose-5-phosphate 4-epimerase and related epimerases and aldolases